MEIERFCFDNYVIELEMIQDVFGDIKYIICEVVMIVDFNSLVNVC